MTVPPALAAHSHSSRSRAWRSVVWVAGLAALSLVAFVAVNAVRVGRQAQRDESRQADAIIVFGAAEYSGHPSPVYRARLDHAYDLFSRGMAPLIITSGGAGADPTYSEGGVGRDYLVRRGIPDRFLIAETQGDDTASQTERAATILRANGMQSALAVSDAYHMFRIKRLLQEQRIHAYASPRPGSLPHGRWARLTAALREAVSYTLWMLHVR